MNAYRFKLEKSSRKHICPSCGKKRFVRYVDLENGAYIPEHYGRCDREVSCAYHLNPYTDGYSKTLQQNETFSQASSTYQARTIASRAYPGSESKHTIPFEVLSKTLRGYERNTFIQYLLSRADFPFAPKDVEKAVSLYYLGTVCKGYMAGAVTFPFIDRKGLVRTIQVKKFDQHNHTTGTDFLHSMIARHHAKTSTALPDWLKAYQKNEKKVSCLFGEHLLSQYENSPVALVEAPKTAVYGSLYFGFPWENNSLLWLAAYNLSSLNLEKCRALKGRRIVLFPDLSEEGRAFDLWSKRAGEIEKKLSGTTFLMSDLLEKHAHREGRAKGYDLADYLIRHDWRSFRSQR